MKRLSSKTNSHLPFSIALAAVLLIVLFLILYIAQKLDASRQVVLSGKSYADLASYMGGYQKPQRNLVLFANNAEIRNGGGFIGSYGIVSANKGKIKLENISNVYNIDYPEVNAKYKVPTPFFMPKLQPYLSLRDSGTELDWSDNARQALFFYENQTGDKVDNVIQITPHVLFELIKKIGPIELKKYGKTVTIENFMETVQLEVEAGRDKAQGLDPKAGILNELAAEVFQKVITKDLLELVEYKDVIQNLIEQKQIVFYSKNDNIQAEMSKLGVTGELPSWEENIFMVTEANVWVDKSTPFIVRDVVMNQTVHADGTSTVDVLLTRKLNSEKKYPYIDPYNKQQYYLVRDNSSFLNVIMPSKAQVITADTAGNQQYNTSEHNLNIVGYRSALDPMESETTHFAYKLAKPYDMKNMRLSITSLIGSQVGGWPFNLHYSLSVPPNYELLATNQDKAAIVSPTQVNFSGTINKDTPLSFIYDKK